MRVRYMRKQTWIMAMVLLLVWGGAILARAESGDNSLYSLGITTEGVTVTPDFYYSTIEYQVLVPRGTKELQLDPVTSSPSAKILDISGTTLIDDSGTVAITVEAENGVPVTYYLYVSPDPDSPVPVPETESETQTEAPTEPATEAPTEPATEAPTEPETEDPRFVKVYKSSLEEADETINRLKEEVSRYRERLDLMIKLLYGLIAFGVVLLFIIINLMIRKRDLKKEVRHYRALEQQGGYGYEAGYYPQEGYQEAYPQEGYQEAYPQEGYQEAYPQEGYQETYPQEGYQETYPQEAARQESDPEKDPGKGRKGPGTGGPGGNMTGGPDGSTGGSRNQAPDGGSGRRGAGSDGSAPERASGNRKAAGPAGKSGRKDPAQADDPATVPRPELSRKVQKSMPSYQKPGKAPNFQPRRPDENTKEVEVTMIDL